MTDYLTSAGVQHYSITIPNGSTSATATINAVGAGAFILHDGVNPSVANDPANDFARVTLTNATTITATRNSGSAGSVIVTGCIIDGNTTNLIKSVQYGTISLASGATSNTATVTAVTNGNTATHLLGWSSASTTFAANQEGPVLSLSGTTVTAARPNSGVALVVGFCIIEFQSGALNQNVQNVAATSSASVTSYTAALTSVNVSNTICIYAGASIATSTTNGGQYKQYGVLTSSTLFTVNSGVAVANAKKFNCSVVEFASGVLKSAVTRGTTTLTGVTSNTSTFGPAVEKAYSGFNWLANSTSATTTQQNRWEGQGVLTNGTTVTVTKNTATDNITASWEIFEFWAPLITGIVKSIHKGVITIAAGATIGTDTFAAVVTANSVVLYRGFQTASTAQVDASQEYPGLVLTNTTTVTAITAAADASAARMVAYTVIEFNSGVVKSNQSGTIGYTGASGTATITAVDLANAFVLFQGQIHSATGDVVDHNSISGWLTLTNATTVTSNISTGSGTYSAYYTCLEFNPGVLQSVQQAFVDIPGGNVTNTANYTLPQAVTVANCMTVYNGFTCGTFNSPYSWESPIAYLANTTTVTFTKGATWFEDIPTQATIVEFRPGVLNSRQAGQTNIGASNTSNTATVTAVNTSQAICNWAGFNNDKFDDYLVAGTGFPTADLTNATTVTLARNQASAGNVYVSWEVIEFFTITITGTFSATEAKDIMAASGKETFTGALAATEAKDVLAAVGKLTFTGTLASTEAKDLMAASGLETITGSLSISEAKDVMSAAGKETFTGALSITEAKDVMAAIGSMLSGYTGTLVSTEALDAMAASGKETFTGAMASTEAKDIMAAIGRETMSGALSITQAKDIMVAVGLETITGTLAVTEVRDAMSASGKETFIGAFAALEFKDTMTATGQQIFIGALAVTEAKDSMAAAGLETITGIFSATEARDLMNGAGKEEILGAFAVLQAKDIMVALGSSIFSITGEFSARENLDAMQAVGLETMLGVFASIEALDAMNSAGITLPMHTFIRLRYKSRVIFPDEKNTDLLIPRKNLELSADSKNVIVSPKHRNRLI